VSVIVVVVVDDDDNAVVRSTSLDSSSHAARRAATRAERGRGSTRARLSPLFLFLDESPSRGTPVASIFQFQGDVESRVTSTPTRDE